MSGFSFFLIVKRGHYLFDVRAPIVRTDYQCSGAVPKKQTKLLILHVTRGGCEEKSKKKPDVIQVSLLRSIFIGQNVRQYSISMWGRSTPPIKFFQSTSSNPSISIKRADGGCRLSVILCLSLRRRVRRPEGAARSERERGTDWGHCHNSVISVAAPYFSAGTWQAWEAERREGENLQSFRCGVALRIVWFNVNTLPTGLLLVQGMPTCITLVYCP